MRWGAGAIKNNEKNKSNINIRHIRNDLTNKNGGNYKSVGNHKIRYEGSLTIETALVLPIFLMAVIWLFDFFAVINYQNVMQYSINYAAQSVGRYAYALNHINDTDIGSALAGEDSDIMKSGVNKGYVFKKIMSAEMVKYTKQAKVINGMGGIYMLDSSINEDESGINDIKVSYAIGTDIFGRKAVFNLANRCYFHSWIGESMKDSVSNVKKGQTVYITRTGKVYHLKSNCSYIRIITSKALYGEVSNMRNANGGKYKACSSCVKNRLKNSDYVYVTSDGKRYHSDDRCSRIKREVTAIDISQAGNRKVCSKCGYGTKFD